MDRIQVIRKEGKSAFAVVEWDLFLKIRKVLEEVKDIKDITDISEFMDIEEPMQDIHKYVFNPVRQMRKEAGLTQKQLAIIMEVSQPYIVKLEKSEHVSRKALENVKKAIEKKNSGIGSILNIFK